MSQDKEEASQIGETIEKEQSEIADAPAPEMSKEQVSEPTPTSTRPRRNARKSVLYNAADYELQLPGLPKQEEHEEPSEMLGESPLQKPPAAKRGKAGESSRGSKKRKAAPHLEEEMLIPPEPLEPQSLYADHSIMTMGVEQEIPHTMTSSRNVDDDGPPVLNIPTEYDDDRMHLVGDDGEELNFDDEDDFLDGRPPALEVNLPSKRRGRPRKRGGAGMPVGGVSLAESLAEVIDGSEGSEKKQPKKDKGLTPMSSKLYRIPGERVVSKTLADRQYHVKLFEDEVEMTDAGECYATVIAGCLAYLLRKERIIELLTNETEIAMIREGGWLLDKPPRLPPLVSHKVCYAFYVDGSKMLSVKDLSNDDLKPWSSSGEHFGDPVIKPNVRRHPVGRINGRLQPVKGDPRLAELHLTEYSAWLPRLLRLRKKIFYLSRDGQIYGNILILYDYTCPGEAPIVVNLPHGNDYLRNAMLESSDPNIGMETDDVAGNSPFEDDFVAGPRGGTFLRVKPSKLGWAHNKKLLLRYLINEQTLLEHTHCLNRRVPYMPPLIPTVGVFVYFVPANFVANQIHHTGDGLSPWTVNPHGDTPSPRVRSTRRALIQDETGYFTLTKDHGWSNTQVCLVETMSVLARCPRLRKRVIYVQRNNSIIIGNVCYIYEYVRDGPIPQPVAKTVPSGVAGGATDIRSPTKRYQPPQQPKRDQWEESKKALTDGNPDGGPSTSAADVAPVPGETTVGEEDQFIDVEDLEVVEEEVIGNVDLTHHEMEMQMTPMHQGPDSMMEEELMEMGEDVLNDGYDVEFDDDPLTAQENPAPYFENPRQLDTGHIYLTVRHKRIAGTFDAVLEWIANTNVVEDRGLLNYAKPGHPPLVRNARAYAFFVAGTAIFPHDINRDDFSPWSHNGNAQNPTCYRTKVRKIGVVCDEIGAQFQIKDVDYKSCPFHLVFLYSINPREPRLRKKIYYMMETESRLVVSHALIMYDYNQEGELPRIHGGYLKRFSKRTGKRPPLQIHDVDNDVSDISESEKECPFAVPPVMADDGTTYLQLLDMEFWNDRNRQLHFLVNKPSLVESLQCLNSRVPALPPATTGKGAFIFFVDGLEVDARNLTCDGLVPWSENNSSNPLGTTRRPKSAKTPLALNRDNQLRVWKTPAHRGDLVEFQLHTYSATLPRCPRLRKKVSYVLKGGHQIGHAMIIYWYTESGEMPTPINMNSLSQDFSLQRLPPTVRDEVDRLLTRMTPPEVAKQIREKYGIQVNPKSLYYLRRREILSMTSHSADMGDTFDIKSEMLDNPNYVDEWTSPLDAGPSGDAGPSTSAKKTLHEMLDESDMQVSHTEEIHAPTQSSRDDFPSRKDHQGQEPRSFLHKNLASTGLIRGTQRNDALWRIAKNSFGAATEAETFDLLFKMLFEKNEQRLLQIVNQTFGVEILAGEEVLDNGEMLHLADGDGEIVEEIVEEVEEEVTVQTGGAQQTGNSGAPGAGGSIQDDEPKVYMDGKTISNGLEQVIVEEEVHDHLLDDVLVEEVGDDPNVIEHHLGA